MIIIQLLKKSVMQYISQFYKINLCYELNVNKRSTKNYITHDIKDNTKVNNKLTS